MAMRLAVMFVLLVADLVVAAVDDDCLAGPSATICDGTRPGAVKALDAAIQKVFTKGGWDSSCFVTSLIKGDHTGPTTVLVLMLGSPGDRCSNLASRTRKPSQKTMASLLPELVAELAKLPTAVKQQLPDVGEISITNGADEDATERLRFQVTKAK